MSISEIGYGRLTPDLAPFIINNDNLEEIDWESVYSGLTYLQIDEKVVYDFMIKVS